MLKGSKARPWRNIVCKHMQTQNVSSPSFCSANFSVSCSSALGRAAINLQQDYDFARSQPWPCWRHPSWPSWDKRYFRLCSCGVSGPLWINNRGKTVKNDCESQVQHSLKNTTRTHSFLWNVQQTLRWPGARASFGKGKEARKRNDTFLLQVAVVVLGGTPLHLLNALGLHIMSWICLDGPGSLCRHFWPWFYNVLHIYPSICQSSRMSI